jgi:hypothetical protein
MSTTTPEFQDPIYITNGGLIILAPFLPRLFEKSGLTQENVFVDKEAQSKAIQLLVYAVTGATAFKEEDVVLNKLLCGMSVLEPTVASLPITTEDKELVESLLTAVTQQWTVLRNTSIDGLRESFLQREGKLEEEATFMLRVQQKGFDVLLDKIPWNITNIHLPWMTKELIVTWRGV